MTTTEATLALGWQHQQAGDLPQAEALYRQVLAAEPNHANALYLLGTVSHIQGRVEEAIVHYRHCLRVKPELAQAHNNLGVAFASQGRLRDAIDCYQEAVRLDPNYKDAANNLQRVLTSLGVAPTQGPETAESLTEQGVMLFSKGQIDEAEACWQRALGLKKLPELHNNLGALYASRGEWGRAVEAYHRALALRPQYAEALNNLGIARYQQEAPEDAARYFRDAIAFSPDYVEAHGNLGNALLALGKPDEARASFHRALELFPDDPRARSNLGVAHASLGEWDEAIACWQRALALTGDTAIYRKLGHAYHAKGDHDEALRWYEQALSVTPTDASLRLLIDALRGTSPDRLPAETVTTQFDEYADTFDEDLLVRLRYRVPELLLSALGPAPSSRSLDVLDLGCGTGLCGTHFREWARSLVGVDLSSRMLDKARERSVYAELIAGDLVTATEAYDARFDLVLAGDVFVYLGDLGPVFRAVHRALRPGGRFAFTVENLDGEGYRLLPTLRFAHSAMYLRQQAAAAGLREMSLTPTILRLEGAQEVAGLTVVLSR